MKLNKIVIAIFSVVSLNSWATSNNPTQYDRQQDQRISSLE